MGRGIPLPKADKSWQARSDMQALQLAREIMADPKRMKAAKTMAMQEVKTLIPIAASGAKAVKKAAPAKGKRLFGG